MVHKCRRTNLHQDTYILTNLINSASFFWISHAILIHLAKPIRGTATTHYECRCRWLRAFRPCHEGISNGNANFLLDLTLLEAFF